MFLNRVLRIVHSENRRSFEIILSELGLTSDKTKTVDTPENRERTESSAGSRLLASPLLSGKDKKHYTNFTVRAAQLAMDRAEIGNCV